MRKILSLLVFAILPSLASLARQADTLETASRLDTLEAAVLTADSRGNYLSKGKEIRTEVISASGLMKMACCNLAESFENSASVTVGYSDATTGARQIRLLGLSGIYTQMLDENRPVMRGLSSPFGLMYIPGSWLESIQIAKGSPSVINGIESMTGQINMEHRKPTDEKPLFVNASVMSDSKTDLNVLSSLQLGEKFYTILMGHVDGNFKTHDMNGDGFMDDPGQLQLNFANRWLYYTPAWQIRWGLHAVRDSREGGQIREGGWASTVLNTSLNGYVKAARSLREDGSASIALVADYTYRKMDSGFGMSLYNAVQQSAFANLIYRNRFNDSHDLTAGINFTGDWWSEDLDAGGVSFDGLFSRSLKLSPYAEYTYKYGDIFSGIFGVSLCFADKVFPAPRITMRYQPSDDLILRFNAGRGVRLSNPVVDNFGILSTGKWLAGDFRTRIWEDSWTLGGNATYYLTDNTYISLDFFRTQFVQQSLLNREVGSVAYLYNLDGHPSWSNTFQADISTEPVERLSLNLTARYTDASVWMTDDVVREVPMTSRFKGVFNAQYKTRLSKWIFDVTASVNGSARVYEFMKELKDADGQLLYPSGRTPAYPLLYAQVTRRFKGFDVYLGGENLTGFRQKMPVIGADNPFSTTFDAASVWGPIMGAKIYAGFRITIWKL